MTLAIASAALACDRTHQESVAPRPPGSPTEAAACSPTTSAGASPLRDPNGPFFHQVIVGRTTDGLTITDAQEVIDHGSVPDGVRLPSGVVLVYYVNGASGGGTWVARVTPDSTRPIGPITLNGVSNPVGVVDPDAVLLPDGRIRLAFLGGFGVQTSDQLRAICIAESTDGVAFTTRGAALTFAPTEPLTDPTQLQLADDRWLMAISRGQQSIIARSNDGLTYTAEAPINVGGVPELALLPGGNVRLYACGNGIVAWRTTDEGRTWIRERTILGPGFNGRPIVCDPSLVAGAGAFIFKSG